MKKLTHKKAVEILPPDPDDPNDEGPLEGERPSVCGSYRGPAMQCPVCYSIYLPFEHMEDTGTSVPLAEAEQCRSCECDGKEKATVEVWITVYPLEAVEKK